MQDFWSECWIEFTVAFLFQVVLQNAMGPFPFCSFEDSSAFAFQPLTLGKQKEMRR